MARQGAAGLGEAVEAWHGAARRGAARLGGAVKAGHGVARRGTARQRCHGQATLGEAW